MKIKQLVEHVVHHLVEFPDQVKVEVFRDGSSCQIEIHVQEDDFKRVVGREGAVIKALKSLLLALQSESNELTLNVIKK